MELAWFSVQIMATTQPDGHSPATCLFLHSEKSVSCAVSCADCNVNICLFVFRDCSLLISPVPFLCFPRCSHMWMSPLLAPPLVSLSPLTLKQIFSFFLFWYSDAIIIKASRNSFFLPLSYIALVAHGNFVARKN